MQPVEQVALEGLTLGLDHLELLDTVTIEEEGVVARTVVRL